MLDGIGSGIGVIIAAGLFAAIAALLSTRESRNKRYDEIRTTDMGVLRAEIEIKRTRNEMLEAENDALRIERTQLTIDKVTLAARVTQLECQLATERGAR